MADVIINLDPEHCKWTEFNSFVSNQSLLIPSTYNRFFLDEAPVIGDISIDMNLLDEIFSRNKRPASSTTRNYILAMKTANVSISLTTLNDNLFFSFEEIAEYLEKVWNVPN